MTCTDNHSEPLDIRHVLNVFEDLGQNDVGFKHERDSTKIAVGRKDSQTCGSRPYAHVGAAAKLYNHGFGLVLIGSQAGGRSRKS